MQNASKIELISKHEKYVRNFGIMELKITKIGVVE